MIQGKMFILYLKCLRSREDKRELSWFKASLLLMSFVFSFLTKKKKLSAAILFFFFFHAEITEKKKHKRLQIHILLNPNITQQITSASFT